MQNFIFYKLPAILIIFLLAGSFLPATVKGHTTNIGSKANLAYSETSRNHTGANAALNMGLVISMEITLNLLEADNSTIIADGALAEYNNIFCACVNLQDAAKFTNSNETFSFLRNGRTLAIERRPIIVSTDTLFLRLTRSTQRNYQLVFTGHNLYQPNLLAFLEDSYTNSSTPLNLEGSASVNFTINADAASLNTDRFRIVFRPAKVLPVTYTDIKAVQQGDNITLKWNVENQLNIRQYEVEKSTDGRNFTWVNTLPAAGSGTLSGVYTWLDMHTVAGDNYYRVRNIDLDGNSAYSKVVQVSIKKNASGIAVYPNPVTGSTIGLQLTNMVKGQYNIRLLSAQGRTLLNTAINHAGGSHTEKIALTSNIAKGIYYLEITDPGMGKTIISVVNE